MTALFIIKNNLDLLQTFLCFYSKKNANYGLYDLGQWPVIKSGVYM